jgi:hypothetical protein
VGLRNFFKIQKSFFAPQKLQKKSMVFLSFSCKGRVEGGRAPGKRPGHWTQKTRELNENRKKSIVFLVFSCKVAVTRLERPGKRPESWTQKTRELNENRKKIDGVFEF